jgi:hypothetical protein
MKRTIISAAVLALGLAGAGVSMADPGPNGHNNHGLCTAYFAGSENGQEHKHNAGPFQQLQEDAGDGPTDSNSTPGEPSDVADYCAPYLSGNGNGNGNNGNPSPGGHDRG